MSVLALIPARGGSKGVPRKNIIPMLGRPLIAWSIRQARESSLIDRVIVSTDDKEIAAVSKEWGAEVPFIRPSSLSQDLSPDIDAFRHALYWLKNSAGEVPEMVVHLRATGPVRDVKLIDEAVDVMLKNPDLTALRSVTLAEQTPYKMWSLKDGRLEPLLILDDIKDSQSMARQMLPKAYWQNGYIDIVRTSTILELDSMTGGNIYPFFIDGKVYDIDYPENISPVENALRESLKLNSSGESVEFFSTNANARHSV